MMSIDHCGLSNFAWKKKRCWAAVRFRHMKDIGSVWLKEGLNLMLYLKNVLYKIEKTY